MPRCGRSWAGFCRCCWWRWPRKSSRAANCCCWPVKTTKLRPARSIHTACRTRPSPPNYSWGWRSIWRSCHPCRGQNGPASRRPAYRWLNLPSGRVLPIWAWLACRLFCRRGRTSRRPCRPIRCHFAARACPGRLASQPGARPVSWMRSNCRRCRGYRNHWMSRAYSGAGSLTSHTNFRLATVCAGRLGAALAGRRTSCRLPAGVAGTAERHWMMVVGWSRGCWGGWNCPQARRRSKVRRATPGAAGRWKLAGVAHWGCSAVETNLTQAAAALANPHHARLVLTRMGCWTNDRSLPSLAHPPARHHRIHRPQSRCSGCSSHPQWPDQPGVIPAGLRGGPFANGRIPHKPVWPHKDSTNIL